MLRGERADEVSDPGRGRSGTGRGIRAAGLAAALALALLASTMVFGPPAYAGGPSAVFMGSVVPDATGELPARVRAVTPDGTVCGSARVFQLEDGMGWYVLFAVAGADKLGCPLEGGAIGFTLLSGAIDEGAPALIFETPDAPGTEHVAFQAGTLTRAHLVAKPAAPATQ